MAQLVKNLPAMQKRWVGPLGWDLPPEKGKEAHPSVLAPKYACTVQSWGRKESDTTE